MTFLAVLPFFASQEKACNYLWEIYPESEEQRCWNHNILNVLDQLPRRAHR